jgi:predicted nucleotidyltransferase component of viral defense system
MLSLSELIQFYPEPLRGYKSFILREYLQCKILQIIFNDQPKANKLCFIGGTSLRLLYNNNRFSEDIDFDHHGLTEKEFESISKRIQQQLELEGYTVEMRNVSAGAYHCYIQFPGLLYKEGLSGHPEQKILIQLDSESQQYDFNPDKIILNKFDVFTEIPVAPLSLLLAQKCYAMMNRKRSKGRDFFDIVFLLSKVKKPDYQYLNQKLGIDNGEKLKEKMLETCARLNMKEMAADVAPFLFNPEDSKKVLLFEQYIRQINFND